MFRIVLSLPRNHVILPGKWKCIYLEGPTYTLFQNGGWFMRIQIGPCCLVQDKIFFWILSLRTRHQGLIWIKTKEYLSGGHFGIRCIGLAVCEMGLKIEAGCGLWKILKLGCGMKYHNWPLAMKFVIHLQYKQNYDHWQSNRTVRLILSNLNLSAGKQAVSLVGMNKSPTCICSVTLEWTALLMGAFSKSRWCPLTREWTVVIIF